MRRERTWRWSGLAALVVMALSGCRATVEGPGAVPRPDPGPGAEVVARPLAPVLVGVIVSQTGPEVLRRYSELVLEGVRLAVDGHQRAGGRSIELIVLDDGGTSASAASLVADLQRRGAVGIVGPLLPQALAAAAESRGQQTGLVLVGPTAPEAPGRPNVYALNASDDQGARALAGHAVRAGIGRVGLLYPRTAESRRQVTAFRQALESAGGQIVADVPFDSGTTTFAAQFRTLRAASPQSIFIPASERDLAQIAPQIPFYGMARSVTVLGNEAWTSEEMIRRLSSLDLRVIATTPLLRESAEVGWQDFVARYEAAHRRSLDNPFPALGHDAVLLILGGIEQRPTDPVRVGGLVAATRELRGATGIFTIRDGQLSRRPFLVRIESGRLVPIP